MAIWTTILEALRTQDKGNFLRGFPSVTRGNAAAQALARADFGLKHGDTFFWMSRSTASTNIGTNPYTVVFNNSYTASHPDLDLSTGTWTAPADGWYFLVARVEFSALTASGSTKAYFAKDTGGGAAEWINGTRGNGNTAGNFWCITPGPVYLDEGDAITVVIDDNGDGSWNLLGDANGISTYFGGCLVAGAEL